MAKRQISKKPLYRKWVRSKAVKLDPPRRGGRFVALKCYCCGQMTAYDKFNGLVVCSNCVYGCYNSGWV